MTQIGLNMSEENQEARDRIEKGIDHKRLAEIQQRYIDAQYGYNHVGYLEYFKDVGELLKERQRLLEVVESYKRDQKMVNDSACKTAGENDDLRAQIKELIGTYQDQVE